jgi:subfamily B ATP-binding cassette protein MsbA
MVEGIEGMKIIRAFGRESYEKKRFDRTSDKLSKLLTRVGIINGLIHPVYEILAAALLVFILLITFQNTDNLATFMVFIFVLYRLQPKVKDLDRARIHLVSLGAAVEDVNDLLRREDKPYQIPGSKPFTGLKKSISFERVTFHYNLADEPVLKDISLAIPAGKTTAIVGTSGAGKSTLIKLILRLYDCSAGDIRIDDLSLQELNLTAWRSKIALVSQDVYVFNTTVRENIAYGSLEATDAEIESAARRADAYDFIQKFPNGFETIVGERGVRLSGGQQQRISLSRAIVRNPHVLILDEATNALDSISESMIQTTLETFGKDRTVIVIAHRLSTIEYADHIIVLEDGCVREQGNLQQLIELDGLFARLYRIQNHSVLKR